MRGGVRRSGPVVAAATAAFVAVGGAFGAPTGREFEDSATYPFRVSCGWRSFDVSALEQPGGVERRDSPLGRAVRRIANGYGPELGGTPDGWRILGRTRRKVELAAGEPPMAWLLVGRHTRFNRGPGWKMLELDSGCYPSAVHEIGAAAAWQVDRADLPLAEDAAGFTAIVEEQSCASGHEAGDRILDPIVRYGGEAIGIAIFVRPRRGWQTCPGNPPSEIEIRLDEPLGERGLRDLAFYPPPEIPTIPPLEEGTAYEIVDEVLTRRFPAYRDPRRIFLDCSNALSATERDCVVLFGDEDFDFRGHLYVALDHAARMLRWSYAFTRTNRRCDARRQEAGCKETVTGEGAQDTGPGP
jgi:hypothetical protein